MAPHPHPANKAGLASSNSLLYNLGALQCHALPQVGQDKGWIHATEEEGIKSFHLLERWHFPLPQ